MANTPSFAAPTSAAATNTASPNTATPNAVVVKTPLQYLDRAAGALRDLGLMPVKVEPAPINALLEKISDLEPDKIALIARTLGQAEVFNEVVREQTSKIDRKSTRLNSSHSTLSRMPSSA